MVFTKKIPTDFHLLSEMRFSASERRFFSFCTKEAVEYARIFSKLRLAFSVTLC